MEFKFSKTGQNHCVSVSRSKQNGRLLRVQHTPCITDKVNRHLSKKMKKKKKEKYEKKKSKSVKSLRYMDEFFPD